AYAIAPLFSDHDDTPPRSFTTGAGSLPDIGTRYKCTSPCSCTVKYTHSPFVDHPGSPCRLSILPSSRRFFPSASISQTCVSSMVVSRSVNPRLVASYTIVFPSGDQCGRYSAFSVAVSLVISPVPGDSVSRS